MLIAIGGQTASGKSDLAIEVAELLGGPAKSAIISVDSMQIYRGLNIGTAKVTPEEMRGIHHYQLDQLEPHEEASVAAYQRHAREDVRRELEKGNTPIAVGGTGLYMRALIDEIEFPETNPEVRQRLNRRLQDHGPQVLHSELEKLDPLAAQQIHPNNGRRIVRALEVIEITGRPFTATLPQYRYHYEPTVQLVIRWDQEELDQRIRIRTQRMFEEGGIVEETRNLLAKGATFGLTAARATGYSQALAVVAGELTVEEAIDEVALATRQLARRQIKWFRRDPRVNWLETESELSLVEQARRIITASEPK